MKWLLLFSLIAFAADGIEDDVAELQKHSADMLKQLQSMSSNINGEKLDAVRAKVVGLASDDRFLKAATELWSHPNRNASLVAQGVFFIFMLFFKAWRQARASNWFTKVFIGLLLSIFTWVGVAYLIPAIVIGAPFRIVVATLWRILFS